ncbi:MAG: YebC/PmpR family DNA-binding transcriptional regulator [Candidatus Parcubacteria bacterium]|nr:YebC/PmpR family DNA-binding transcriptional regulator [Candidatus Parcubacteria bacterium]
MSGHSHWATIKRKKGATDAKRGQEFSKMVRVITIAAREGGSDPITNSKLRMVIERAKQLKMPSENIERAIKRGTGGEEGVKLEESMFEAYGPGKVAIIIDTITDNKNRTLGEVKQILNQHGGKLAEVGSVKWMFEQKGAIVVNLINQPEDLKNKEALELKVIEAGAEDISWFEDNLDVYTKIEELENVKKNLEKENVVIESSSLDWIAKDSIPVTDNEKQSLEKLFEALDESDSVQNLYSNLAS